MTRKYLTLVAIAILGFAVSGSAGAQTEQKPSAGGTSTATKVGTVVGTGISAALSAAFPAAATIINAIWGKDTNKGKTAAQAQTPLNTLQKTTVAQVQQLSADLDTVNIFLVDCVMADRSVIQMQDILGKKSTLSIGDKQQLTAKWNDASPRITELGKDSAKAAANAVSDEYIRRSLLAISEANYGDLANVKDDIANGNGDDLRDRLSALEPKLSGVAALSGDIIGQVSSGLHNAAKNMAPSQGLADEQEKSFVTRAAENQAKLETILKDVYSVTPRGTQQ
jgi:hypothetical protein